MLSPKAYTPSILVSKFSLTSICPLSPKLIPEPCKNLVSGLTPIDNITISVVTIFPLSSLIIILFASS